MIDQELYIVVLYGCNSSLSDMWVPESNINQRKLKLYIQF